MNYSDLKITPYTPHFGVSVSGLNQKLLGEKSTFKIIRKLLANHLVVSIHDQELTALQLRDFVRQFGPLFHHHADEGVLFAEGLPEVLEMRKEPDGTRLFGGSDWHADVTFRNPPGFVSVLYAREIPTVGGDTGFANTISAYNSLSKGMQKMLSSLNAVHSYNGRGQPDHPEETATHPVVKKHSESGQYGVYLNRMFVTRFSSMLEKESEPLIDFLDKTISRPEFTMRHRWRVGDVVLWDNRFTLHYPINDFHGERRSLYRCVALDA